QVGDDVVPLPGQLGFLQKIFDLLVHGYLRAAGRMVINANDTSRSPALVERPPGRAPPRWRHIRAAVAPALIPSP
ncbi:MAG TPA: hypothetical protein VH642_01320, partial [Streptosporangiaceae bacterium]